MEEILVLFVNVAQNIYIDTIWPIKGQQNSSAN